MHTVGRLLQQHIEYIAGMCAHIYAVTVGIAGASDDLFGLLIVQLIFCNAYRQLLYQTLQLQQYAGIKQLYHK